MGKYKTVWAVLMVLITGCGPRLKPVDTGTRPVMSPEYMERYGPDEYGVVCYRYYYQPLSCVKVKDSM